MAQLASCHVQEPDGCMRYFIDPPLVAAGVCLWRLIYLIVYALTGADPLTAWVV